MILYHKFPAWLSQPMQIDFAWVCSENLEGLMHMGKNFFKMQFLLMVHKKAFQISFLISLFYVFLTYIFYCATQFGMDISNILSADSVFVGNSSTAFINYLNVLFPFLVVMPFGFSFLTDKSINILPIIQTRIGVKRYYFVKMMVCFIGGFIIFFIPFVLNIIFNYITFPSSGKTFLGLLYDWNYSHDLTGENVSRLAVSSGLPFLKLYILSPLVYNLLYSFIFSAYMGILSVFCFSVSFLIKKNKIILFVPVFAIIYGLNMLTAIFDNEASTFTDYFIFHYITVDTMYGKSVIFIALITSAFIFISVFLCIRQTKIDQIGWRQWLLEENYILYY